MCNRRLLLTAAVVASCLVPTGSVNPAEAASAVAGKGVVTGRVTVGPQLLSRRARFDLYADMRRGATPQGPQTEEDELANVVVWLEDASGRLDDLPLATGRAMMRQERSTFVPHVLAVARGTTVDFPNSDPVFHNVFSLSKPASFDLGRYPRGESRSVRFEEPGMVKVFCQIHSDMSGVVLVLPHGYFTAPSEDGTYRIEGVPPGDYQVVGWHERARRVSHRVRVEPNGTARADLEIPLGSE
jgi:plastocyanin